MLYQVAIMKYPSCEEARRSVKETILYGPVTVQAGDHNFNGAALRVVSEAANAGKLPDGYDDSTMRIIGIEFHTIA